MFILAFIGIGTIQNTYAHSLIVCNDTEKTYISCDQITISNDGIFVVSENEMIDVQAIFQDETGIYYIKVPSIYWSCKKCGFQKNPAWTNYCKVCKKRYNE